MLLLLAFGCGKAPLTAVISGPEGAPVVIALHGLGDRPESLLALVASCGLPVRIVAPRGPIPSGEGYSWFDVRGFGEALSLDEPAMIDAVDRLAAQIPSWRSEGRPLVVMGFSQGGMLSFGLALRHPDLVDAVLPIGGTWPEPLLPSPLPARLPPIRAQHGTDDTVVALAPTAQLVERLARAGYDAEIAIEPGLGHTVSEAQRRRLCRELAAL